MGKRSKRHTLYLYARMKKGPPAFIVHGVCVQHMCACTLQARVNSQSTTVWRIFTPNTRTVQMVNDIKKWFPGAEKSLDYLTVIHLPVTKSALKKAIPGHISACTVANSFIDFTGLDAKDNQIQVDAQFVKFVKDDKRYFLVHEVVGAEHVKQLDSLALGESGKIDTSNFKEFVLKLRAHAVRPVHTRGSRVVSENIPLTGEKEQQTASSETTNTVVEIKKDDVSNGIPVPVKLTEAEQGTISQHARRIRSDAGKKKSRWAFIQ